MARRTYRQACPLAFSLDIVGERWTLLIVRDLLMGPLRYSDLLARLPGIGRNLLAERLKQLQEEEIVERRQLDPPSASTVYALTEKGRGLEKGIYAFVDWGHRYSQGDDRFAGHFQPEHLGLAFKLRFDPERAGDLESVHEIAISGRTVHLRIADGHVEVRRGPATNPRFRMSAEAQILATALFAGSLNIEQAISAGELTIEGDRDALVKELIVYGIEAAD